MLDFDINGPVRSPQQILLESLEVLHVGEQIISQYLMLVLELLR